MALGDRAATSLADVATHVRPERCRPTGRSVLSAKNGRRSGCAVRRTEGPVGRPRSAECKVPPWAGPEAAREPAPGRTGRPRRDHRAGLEARRSSGPGPLQAERRPPPASAPTAISETRYRKTTLPQSAAPCRQRPSAGAPRRPSRGARGRPRGPGGSRPGVTRQAGAAAGSPSELRGPGTVAVRSRSTSGAGPARLQRLQQRREHPPGPVDLGDDRGLLGCAVVCGGEPQAVDGRRDRAQDGTPGGLGHLDERGEPALPGPADHARGHGYPAPEGDTGKPDRDRGPVLLCRRARLLVPAQPPLSGGSR